MPYDKKAIPGAGWDGSRFLSRSATATCSELSILNLLPLGKQKQAFGQKETPTGSDTPL